MVNTSRGIGLRKGNERTASVTGGRSTGQEKKQRRSEVEGRAGKVHVMQLRGIRTSGHLQRRKLGSFRRVEKI